MRDPFGDALCRETGRDPAMWDTDADLPARTYAAVVCAACPAVVACAARRDELGPLASGTWAALYVEWVDHVDPLTTAFDAVFGASFTQTPVAMETQMSLFEEAL